MIFDVHKTVKYVWGFEIQIRIRVYWKMDIFLNGDLKVLRKEITNQTGLRSKYIETISVLSSFFGTLF